MTASKKKKKFYGYYKDPAYCWKTSKVMFDKKGAISAANKRYAEDHVRLRVYVCPICKSWHLTKLLISK